LTARPATERTIHDLEPMDEDQGIAALAKMVRPEPEAVEEVEEVEEDDAESSPEDSEETEVQDDQDENLEPDEQETDDDSVTLADGSTVTSEEAKRGYLRESDYTKKAMALAEERRIAGEQIAATTRRLEALVNDLEQQATQEPDWNALIDEYGADQVMKSQMAWNEQKKSRESAVQAVQAQRDQQHKQAVAAARGELMAGTYDPTWTDPKKLEAGLLSVAKYAEDTYGIPTRDLAQNTDPNVFVILDKARKYDALQSKAPSVKKKMVSKPKPLKPGSSSTVKAVRPTRDAFAQARKTGTDEDALAALGSLRRAS
jgi:hypothetical protein